MSNVEHLIENAICDMERGRSYDDYVNAWPQKAMLPMVYVRPEELWEIAQYVVTTYRDSILYGESYK